MGVFFGMISCVRRVLKFWTRQTWPIVSGVTQVPLIDDLHHILCTADAATHWWVSSHATAKQSQPMYQTHKFCNRQRLSPYATHRRGMFVLQWTIIRNKVRQWSKSQDLLYFRDVIEEKRSTPSKPDLNLKAYALLPRCLHKPTLVWSLCIASSFRCRKMSWSTYLCTQGVRRCTPVCLGGFLVILHGAYQKTDPKVDGQHPKKLLV